MSKTHQTRFWSTLFQRPSPADFQAVLQAGPLGALITSVIAVTYAFNHGCAGDGDTICLWAGATVLLSLVIFIRGRRAAEREVAYVSRAAASRIGVFSALLAAPWSVLALLVLGRAEPSDQMIALMICAGMSAGGAFALHRIVFAALIYIVLILVSVAAAFMMRDHVDMWPVALYSMLYGASLSAFAVLTSGISEGQERSNQELSQMVDDLHAAHEEISVLAFVDPVTDLPNRSVFGRQVLDLIEAADDETEFAVLLLDLDGFKNVNDGIGYQAGDQLLQIVAGRLQEALCAEGEVARLWADEFALVLRGHNPRSALMRANEIITAVSEPATIEGRAVYPNASVGGAFFPHDGQSENELIRKATIALHRAKEHGRGRSLLYTDAMSERIAEVDRLEHDLHVALLERQIEINYQPKIDLGTGAPLGAEALVRWRHPVDGMISPDRFLSVAADRGMMLDVSAYIFESICNDILAWRQAGHGFGKIAINIHPLDLKAPKSLLDNLRWMLDRGVRQSDVVLEITEGCFVGKDTDDAALALDSINEMGFELSLDDFGTGHASLSHLRNLPVNELKIDRAFVSGICDNQHDLAIVRATIEIARCLNLRTVAEGVETVEQITALREVGAEIGQGYHWLKPVPAADYLAFFERQSASARAQVTKAPESGIS